jgi:uncharacterized membrane protein YphA (DoxX/SURF4 family)
MKKLIVLVQWIVGLLFIFSGLIKANDPLGLSYKMQEFFEVWNWKGLDDYTLALSIIMNTFEVVAGVAIIVGWQRRLFTWLLLLLIIFFSFLTGYALFSGKIKTCGCFGDCIPLKAGQSFAKDIFLLVLILLLVLVQRRITAVVRPSTAFSILAFSTIGTLGLQWYVLKHLPFVDCLPYREGKDLKEQMKIPTDAVQDSIVIYFKYRKEGRIVEFNSNNTPELDSTFEYISREDKLVREGNARPAITDFKLFAESGADVTDSVLGHPGKYLLLFIYKQKELKDWKPLADAAIAKASRQQLPVYIVSAAVAQAQQAFPGVRVLGCDAVVIKTVSRADATFYLMNRSVVLKKASAYDADKFSEQW